MNQVAERRALPMSQVAERRAVPTTSGADDKGCRAGERVQDDNSVGTTYVQEQFPARSGSPSASMIERREDRHERREDDETDRHERREDDEDTHRRCENGDEAERRRRRTVTEQER